MNRSPSPKHLDKGQEQSRDKNMLHLLNAVMWLIKGMFLLCLGVFLYGIFYDSITSGTKPVLSQEQYEIVWAKNHRAEQSDIDRVENGVHVQTGLVFAAGFEVVRPTCTACHSAKLITQNRATKEGWLQMIRWMQEKQGLWDLGKNEPIILDYLAKYYAPQEVGRRQNIDIAAIEWYILNIEE